MTPRFDGHELCERAIAVPIAKTKHGLSTALAVARLSDLVATAPELHTASLREGMVGFALPVRASGFAVSLVWRPRLDADPVHRWLRACIRAVCAAG